MSFANFTLLWLFGGRNNILIWMTGWSFATFNVFHRHIARVATLQGIAHSVLYFVIIVRSKCLTYAAACCVSEMLSRATLYSK